jgi:methyl-accepting chemotaxis protein
MKLRIKMTLIVAGIAAAAIAGLAVLLLVNSSNIVIAASVESSRRLAEKNAVDVKRQYDGYVQTARTMSDIFSRYEDVPRGQRRTQYNQILQQVFDTHPELVAIYTVWYPDALDGMDAEYAGETGYSPEGQYIPLYSRETGKTVFRICRSYNDILSVLTEDETVGDPEDRKINDIDGKSVDIIVPINNPQGKLVGAVGMIFNLAYLQGVITQVVAANDEIDAAAMYTTNETIVAHTIADRIGKTLEEGDGGLYTDNLAQVGNAVKNGEALHIKEYSQVRQTNVHIFLAPYHIGNSKTAWTLMIAIPESVMLSGVRRMAVFGIGAGAAFIVVISVIVLLVVSGITKPIVKVSATLKDISEGEGDLTRSVEVHTKDEVGDLARYFNSTLEKIKALIISIRNEAGGLSKIGDGLAANMTQTATAINEITENITEMSGQVTKQDDCLDRAQAAMATVVGYIKNLSGQVEQQTESVSRSSSAVEEMLANIKSVTDTLVKNAENVQSLTAASEVGREGLQDVSADIQGIARESEGLLEINEVMQNIASQTNLLSMNAAIEAAHAGEAGKGFAVVADEIRKLAESSGEQSKTISNVLKKIKASIDKITASTETVLNKFEAIDSGVRTVKTQEETILAAMEEQNTGSQQILESISALNSITQEVRNSSVEMNSGSDTVNVESGNLELVAKELSQGISEMAAGAQQITAAVTEVHEATEKNKAGIESLVREVNRFKVD